MRIGNPRYWLFQLCGWGLFALITIFINWSFDQMATPGNRLLVSGRLGFFVVLGITLTHVMRLVIIRWNVLQKKLEKQILQFFLLTLVFSLAGSLLDISLLIETGLLIKKEKELLEAIVSKPIHSSRQHFIRFHLPETFRQLISAGIWFIIPAIVSFVC